MEGRACCLVQGLCVVVKVLILLLHAVVRHLALVGVHHVPLDRMQRGKLLGVGVQPACVEREVALRQLGALKRGVGPFSAHIDSQLGSTADILRQVVHRYSS